MLNVNGRISQFFVGLNNCFEGDSACSCFCMNFNPILKWQIYCDSDGGATGGSKLRGTEKR